MRPTPFATWMPPSTAAWARIIPLCSVVLLAGSAAAQSTPPEPAPPGSLPSAARIPGNPVASGSSSSAPASAYNPTWESQKQARTWVFNVPAPRGQICDRNGEPLVQQRVGSNLGISFPRPFQLQDEEVDAFVAGEARKIGALLGREILVQPGAAQKHYRNRPLLPWILLQNLSAAEQAKVRQANNPKWELLPFYARHYPHGKLAGHVLGYVGRSGKFQDGAVENNEPLFPDTEGRYGLEKTFDQVLRGESGQWNVTYNGAGRKASEQISITPVAGKHVITTLDLSLQRMAEAALASGTKRGAMVIMDPHSGDILAMASWPPLDPSLFVPAISEADYAALSSDKNNPLYPRFSMAAYPPGSTFKCFVGLAALASGKLTPNDEFDCPPGFQIGDRIFHNWKREERGMLNFAEALEQSCNTWFYQAGLKMGADVITDYAQALGFGERTGIPIPEESPGLVPTDEYMREKHNVRMAGGQLAMLAIGQGATEITPLQMAQAMCVIGNGGRMYQARLVQQVQDITGEVVSAYSVRVRREMEIPAATLSALRLGMSQVVRGSRGTAHQAKVDKVTVAGKTGTAQWRNNATVAWFAGFAPAEGPRLAFAVVYEGDPHRNDVHGGSHAAPMVGKVLREYFKDPSKAKPVLPKDENGNEIEPPEIPLVPRKAAPANESGDQETAPMEPTQAPASPPTKSPFWRRIFG
jgi:penicillin-binding protein 2